jgi:hypothetical protein
MVDEKGEKKSLKLSDTKGLYDLRRFFCCPSSLPLCCGKPRNKDESSSRGGRRLAKD